MTSFGGIFHGRRVLVTGHTGFKGSWLSLWLTRMGAEVTGIALPPDTNPAHWTLLRIEGMADRRVDLRDKDALHEAIQAARPEILFHLAAQPLVRRSYRTPVETFDVNVMGLVNLLEVVRATESVRVLINATTDKVYAERHQLGGYTETAPLGGHDPYSTSKACAELITESYRKSFLGERVRMATARAGNVIGGGDWAEDRLVPDIVRACVSGQPLRLRHPRSIRPWQHVLEPLSGYLRLAQLLWSAPLPHPAWNFGPRADDDLPVAEIAAAASKEWQGFVIVGDEDKHVHEAATLRLDSTLAREHLGWRPVWSAATAITRTMRWYRRFHEHGDVGTGTDIDAYIDDASREGLPWTV